MQSKKHSHYEITANQIAGLIIGWCLVFYIFPFIGVETTVTQASLSSMMFFFASYSRAYVIRRIFNNRAVIMRTEEQDWEDLEKKLNPKTTDCRKQTIMCTYPECNCPFDMGADNLCLRGYPNVTSQMRNWFMETFGYAADDCSVLTRFNERFKNENLQ